MFGAKTKQELHETLVKLNKVEGENASLRDALTKTESERESFRTEMQKAQADCVVAKESLIKS